MKKKMLLLEKNIMLHEKEYKIFTFFKWKYIQRWNFNAFMHCYDKIQSHITY